MVHTVEDIHDGWPLAGMADFEGRPHEYRRILVEDDWSNLFRLAEIDAVRADWLAERWRIWLRWKDARRTGDVPLVFDDSYGALPQDMARRDQLDRLIKDRDPFLGVGAFTATVEFKGTGGDWTHVQALWVPVTSVT